MNKKITLVIIPVFVLTLSFAAFFRTFAQAPSGTALPTVLPSSAPTAVISDYAKDVQEGKQLVLGDSDAKSVQKEVADNESVEAQEETETAEPQEAIEPEEAVEPQEAVEAPESEGGIEQKGESGSSEGSKPSGESSNTDGSAGSTGESK